MPHTLSKKERLCGERKIAHLFDNGESGFTYPFRYVYLTQECTTSSAGSMNTTGYAGDNCVCSCDDAQREFGVGADANTDAQCAGNAGNASNASKKRTFTPIEEGVSVLVSVSKRYHKRANKRNLIKRRMREAYRQNNDPLKQNSSISGKHLNLALIYSSKEVVEYKTVENAIKKIITTISEGL